jgi:hypothetical protein
MNARSIALVILALCLPLALFIAFKWIKIFNSADGERYMRRRTQGPFAPLSGEDSADDQTRLNAADAVQRLPK